MAFTGDELRARRTEAGLSRKDIYKKLRIPIDFIQAVEDGQLDRLPPIAYALGFMRTYCKLLGVNPEPYVDALQARAHTRRSFLRLGAGDAAGYRPAWLNEAIAWATILLIAVLGWAAYTVVFRPQAPSSHSRVQAGTLNLRLPLSIDDRP